MSYSPKSSLALFRDCLRLVKHMAGTTSPKAIQLRKIVADEFRKNKNVTDPAQLHSLKSSAERALSNYLIFMNSKTDPRVSAHVAKQDTYIEDEKGNMFKVIETNQSVSYPSVRVSRSQQATGELPEGTPENKRKVKNAK